MGGGIRWDSCRMRLKRLIFGLDEDKRLGLRGAGDDKGQNGGRRER